MNEREGELAGGGLRRREVLIGLGAAGLGVAWRVMGSTGALARVAPVTASAAAGCVLTPEVTEGPYWIANHFTRRNITEGKPGLPLALHITAINASTCNPIHNADVEIWHADASGVYSGYGGNVPPSGGGGGHATPNNSHRFLRGHQKSDAKGRVLFDTIYPGWYRGRTPHIHIKVHVRGNVVHKGQLFFADPISDAVYRTAAYKSHGQPDTTNAADSIYAQAGGSVAQVHVTKRPGHPGDSGKITVGVRV